MPSDVVLATIPGGGDQDRLQVVLSHDLDGRSTISLRQQSWGDGVGWFTQASLDLTPGQLRQLRTLGGVPAVSAAGHSSDSASLRWDEGCREEPSSSESMFLNFAQFAERAESA